ncbi:Rieske (2Fe-2S) protein [Bacillus tianshenii]|nr:Rieske (2Fe-2S) protein [Bacillus tianshenii]
MNRLEFFHYVKKSVVDTVKYAASPLIEEDVKKIDRWTDELAGIVWIPCELDLSRSECMTTFLNGKSLAFFYNDEVLRCVDLTCVNCETLVHWYAFQKEFKCLTCEHTYQVSHMTGELEIQELPLKREYGQLLVGFERK